MISNCANRATPWAISTVSGILTIRFDPKSQAHFEEMRQRYFPPERNLVPAHLTLFHVLPTTEEVCSTLARTASVTTAFAIAVTGLRSLGRGVAYTLAGPELHSVHRLLSFSFAVLLSAQDKQKFQPHVVIQNKSTGEQASELLTLLQASFQAFTVEARGLDLWHYRDGPWELARQFDFID
jgi:2'-5' RNA ligase